ncbi:MAG TPA: septum formation protein Maf, partial [Gammaproteobacteria bacterium]|nr:septum formation protein Maf [Gammaproteobacteria bacterium]
SLSDVTFRELSERDRVRYWDSGEPAGKAGAYGIQGLGAAFVSRMSGSYSGVVGLPLFETAALLAECGLDVWAGECG